MRTLLLLVVGLAVGLYLGFNPVTRRDLTRWWNREIASQGAGKPHAAAAIRQLDSRLARSLKSSPKPLARTAPQTNTVPTTGQIGAELHAFWLALQRIWLTLWAQLRL